MSSLLDQALSGVVLLTLLAGSHGAKPTCAQQTKPRLCLRVLMVGEPLPDNLDAGLNIPETQINEILSSKDTPSPTSRPAEPSPGLPLSAETAGEPSNSNGLEVSRANEDKKPDESQYSTKFELTQQKNGNSSAGYHEVTEHKNESSTTGTSISYVQTDQAKVSTSNELQREVSKAAIKTKKLRIEEIRAP